MILVLLTPIAVVVWLASSMQKQRKDLAVQVVKGDSGMKYCSNCGAEVNEAAVVCVKCGVAVAPQRNLNDAPSAGYAVLGFFFPLIGLILYLVWKDQTPLRAKSAGKGALIAVILWVSIYALIFVLAIIGSASY